MQAVAEMVEAMDDDGRRPGEEEEPLLEAAGTDDVTSETTKGQAIEYESEVLTVLEDD